MYINDIHILCYIVVILLGIVVGQFTDWMIKRFSDEKRIFEKGAWKEFKENFTPNLKLIIITVVSYVLLLIVKGWNVEFIQNLTLIKYFILVPILITAFIIDYRLQIIPNRLTLFLFEVGLVFLYIYAFVNISISLDMIYGLLAGGGIFLLITLIGGLIAGKEAMGFGDVKFMCGLGLLFGLGNIIIISILSFFIGAILSIILLATKKKSKEEYIPFGPFIVIGVAICMIVPNTLLATALMKIFTLGMV